MFEYYNNSVTNHSYTFACTGLKVKSDTFNTRPEANEHMYEILDKYGLHIIEIYDDHHDKTYICNNGVRFYIHRV